MNRKLIFSTALLLLAGNAVAQTDTSEVLVQVEGSTLTLTNNAGLNFGRIVPYGSNGIVQVHADSSYGTSGVLVLDPASISASSWSVNGTAGAPYDVIMPTAVTISNINNSSDTMTVYGFSRSLNSNTGNSQLFLDGNGNDTFTVGAVLGVNANQAAGIYTGTFNVTVNYN
jgi:Mat/Ecp fimbriae major subunit